MGDLDIGVLSTIGAVFVGRRGENPRGSASAYCLPDTSRRPTAHCVLH